jgi:hypothetical protein
MLYGRTLGTTGGHGLIDTRQVAGEGGKAFHRRAGPNPSPFTPKTQVASTALTWPP